MTDTLSLFDMPLSRRDDPATSHAAAARVASVSPHLTKQILDAFGRYRTMTKDQVCERLGLDPRRWPTCASALSRLKNDGILCWTGETVHGQNVWRLRETSVDVAGERL